MSQALVRRMYFLKKVKTPSDSYRSIVDWRHRSIVVRFVDVDQSLIVALTESFEFG